MFDTKAIRDTYDMRYVLIRPELPVAWAGGILEAKPDGTLVRALGS